ncbi:MAG: twin-arginine translocase subunit TatB [Alphaproteobacteria bacterium]|nr:twin-arginine translocase subunit TatB [Alphaproteobacteria bacterium]
MFDLGWSEILVIAVVAILVVGPNDLPRMMRTIGEWVGKMRRMAQHFQAGVDEMIRQSELEDLRKDLKTIHREVNAPLAPARVTAPPAAQMVRTEASAPEPPAQPAADAPPAS